MAVVHDYLTQRGGAERVVLAIAETFPDAPIHTSLYDPRGTFPAFALRDVRTTALNRISPLRRHHRLALPLLAPAFSAHRVDADVVICSSSGWAHGVNTAAARVVYCYTPARWLYAGDLYAGRDGAGPRRAAVRGAMATAGPVLRRWDQRAARRPARWLVTSTEVRERVRAVYGVDAEVLPPPPGLLPGGTEAVVPGITPGFWLCVSRLLPYKNVDAVLAAARLLPDELFVVAGGGPDLAALRAAAPTNVRLVGTVADAQLRWLYGACRGVVAPSHEDFGLVPLEAAGFGRATAALRWGGFLDTVVEGSTGVFFDTPTGVAVAVALRELIAQDPAPATLRARAAGFSAAAFSARMRAVVAEAAEAG